MTGLLLDSRHPTGSSAGIQLSVAAGIVPNPVAKTDTSYWERTISAGQHRVGWGARFAVLPDYVSTRSFGLLAGRYRLDASELELAGRLEAP
jgi:hypothetical protein